MTIKSNKPTNLLTIIKIDDLMTQATNPANTNLEEKRQCYLKAGELMAQINIIKKKKATDIEYVSKQYNIWREKRTKKAIDFRLHKPSNKED